MRLPGNLAGWQPAPAPATGKTGGGDPAASGVVSHYLEQVNRIADRIHAITDGRIQLKG